MRRRTAVETLFLGVGVGFALLAMTLILGRGSLCQAKSPDELEHLLHPIGSHLLLYPVLSAKKAKQFDPVNFSVTNNSEAYQPIAYSALPGLSKCQPSAATLYLLVIDDSANASERSFAAKELQKLLSRDPQLQHASVSIINESGRTAYRFPTDPNALSAVALKVPLRDDEPKSPSRVDAYKAAILAMGELPGPRAVLFVYGIHTLFYPHRFDPELTSVAARAFATSVAPPSVFTERYTSMQGVVAASGGVVALEAKDLSRPMLDVIARSGVVARHCTECENGDVAEAPAMTSTQQFIGKPFPSIDIPCSADAVLSQLSVPLESSSLPKPSAYLFPLRTSTKTLALLFQDVQKTTQPATLISVVKDVGSGLSLMDHSDLKGRGPTVGLLYLLSPGTYQGFMDVAGPDEFRVSLPVAFQAGWVEGSPFKVSTAIAGTLIDATSTMPLRRRDGTDRPEVLDNSPFALRDSKLIPRLPQIFAANEPFAIMVRVVATGEAQPAHGVFTFQRVGAAASQFQAQVYANPRFGTAFVWEKRSTLPPLPSGTYNVNFAIEGTNVVLASTQITIQ